MRSFKLKLKNIILAGALLGGFGIAAVGFGTAGNAATLPRDCDATSIIWCGSLTVDELKADYNSKDGGRYTDIPAVFNHFGITSSDINGLNGSNHKRGIVKADNTVWVDGKLIGVNAKTAGRVNKPGSTAIAGTKAFKRSPSVSFASSNTQIDAFIGYKDGKPAWAVLSSCGNPVTWDKPSVEVEKSVRSADNKSWVENDTFANNSTLTYRILVKNPSKVDAANVTVKDTLPAGQTFVKGSVRVNGNTAQGTDNLVGSSGYKIASVKAGSTVEITFQAKVSVAETKCGVTSFVNKARVESDFTPPKEDTAGSKIDVVCVTLKCVSLTADKLSVEQGQQITFTAKSELENANLTSYEFRVNGQVVQNTTSNTYVHMTDAEGDFTAKVTVKTDKGEDTNLNCEERFTVKEKPVCPYNPELAPDHPDCKKPEVCPYNPDLPKDSPDCVKPEKPEEPKVRGVSTLPKTGAAGIAGVFAATSLSGAAVHHLLDRRRK